MSMRLRLGALLAPLALAGAYACGSGYSSSDSPPSDAGIDATPAEAAGPVDTCAHTGPPPAPASDDAPATELPPFYLAISDVVVTTDQPIGLDLDAVCTCDPSAGAAHGGASSCSGPTKHCDDDGGIDNVLGPSLVAFASFLDANAAATTTVKSGRRDIVIYVKGYNGRANDREVSIGIIASEGIREPGCPTSVYDDKKMLYSPGNCGDDHWSLSSDSVIQAAGQVLPVAVGAGYVNDFTLVVRVSGAAAIPLGEDGHAITFGAPVMSAKLTPLHADLTPRDPSSSPAAGEERYFALDGVLGGRIAAPDLLATIGTQAVGGSSSRFCQSPLFDVAKQRVCSSLDISRSDRLDFDPQAACDAVSGAVLFKAAPMLPGAIVTPTPNGDPCSPGPDGNPVDAGVTYSCP
jgi:hypothetical protein